MAAGDASARILGTLEAMLDEWAEGRKSAVLAFSGGLSSLSLAALLRKRLDLECIVVGTAGAPDFAAAERAADFLDYRVRPVELSDARLLSFARRCVRGSSRGMTSELAYLPLLAVDASAGGRPCIGGYRGDSGRPGGLARGSGPFQPFLSTSGVRGLPRPALQDVVRLIGLPEAFVRVRPRTPLVGTGFQASLTRIAQDRGVTLRSLLERASS